MSSDLYKAEVIEPGDTASQLARDINVQSYNNCAAVRIVPHEPGNWRGPVGFTWSHHILEEMAAETKFNPITGQVKEWTYLVEVQNDGAGGKPQFFTFIGTPEVFRGLGWEIIAMNADDLARSGILPCVMVNEIQVKRVTRENFPLVKACFEGYGAALTKCGLTNITGEFAVMKHSITAFCDEDSNGQLVLTWGGSCIGLVYRHSLIKPKLEIVSGQPIVGFLEAGYRCNGGTFFTSLLKNKFGPDINRIRADSCAMDMVRKLTIPSQCYAPTICRLLGWEPDGSFGNPLADIHGIAHITGGGVWAKFGEILPDGVGAMLSSMPQPAAVLLEAQELSWGTELQLTDLQAYGTFHGGCGMLLVCDSKDDADRVIHQAANDGIEASIVGETTKSPDNEIIICSRFKERRVLCSNELKKS